MSGVTDITAQQIAPPTDRQLDQIRDHSARIFSRGHNFGGSPNDPAGTEVLFARIGEPETFKEASVWIRALRRQEFQNPPAADKLEERNLYELFIEEAAKAATSDELFRHRPEPAPAEGPSEPQVERIAEDGPPAPEGTAEAPEPADLKRCSRCKEEKALDEFHRNKTSKDGLNWECKLCARERAAHARAARDKRTTKTTKTTKSVPAPDPAPAPIEEDGPPDAPTSKASQAQGPAILEQSSRTIPLGTRGHISITLSVDLLGMDPQLRRRVNYFLDEIERLADAARNASSS